jgi:hypothetical protein
MIQHLTAVQFTRFMTSGRTTPALLNCEDESGRSAGDWVVKLRGSVRQTGLLRELLGNRLASHFDLPTPEPALITLETALVDLIAIADRSKAVVIKGSIGLNFGSREMIGYIEWPVDMRIPDAIWQTAANVFAFDALVQNPDRRFTNANLFVKGDSLLVFDHETAFSFLDEIFPSTTPWMLRSERYLADHVFYRQLKSKTVDLTDFTSHLIDLSDAVLDQILAEAPAEWNNEDGQKIAQHLCGVRDHAEEFAEQVRRFLV